MREETLLCSILKPQTPCGTVSKYCTAGFLPEHSPYQGELIFID
jgi:hypothetical protein